MVAAAVARPEILLMDEWLAAGDAACLSKARQRMEDFLSGTSVLVLASRSLSLVKESGNRAVLLDHGRVAAIGSVDDGAAACEGGRT